MRYKLLGLTIILLVATPSFVSGQGPKMSPIIVKTGKPIPSVVKSGEPFKITYQATYTDAVLIIEDQMRFDSLILVADNGKTGSANPATGEVEVVNLVISEKVREGSDETGFVNVQDFTYTFMIINERKGNDKIPSFNFIWVRKKAGMTAAEAKERGQLKEFPTREVGISYVTSIVRSPTVDIRDGTRFDNFKVMASRASMTAYGTVGLTSLIALITIVRFYRRPGVIKIDSESNTVDESVPQISAPKLSLRKVRRNFVQGLKEVKQESASAENDPSVNAKTGRKLYSLVRSLLLAELSEDSVNVSDSSTPKQIGETLRKLTEKQKRALGSRHKTLLEMAERLQVQYQTVESGDRFSGIDAEADRLNQMSACLKRSWWKWRKNRHAR